MNNTSVKALEREAENVHAVNALAILLSTGGNGVEQDYVRSAKQFSETIEKGNLTRASCNFAFFLSTDGQGVALNCTSSWIPSKAFGS